MRALVIGGTGGTGVPIVEGLLARGAAVTVYNRGLHKIDFSCPVEQIHGDPFSKEAIFSDLAEGTYDLAVSTYGRLRHVAAALTGRVGQFIAITSGASYIGYRNYAHGAEGLPSPIPESHPTYRDKEVDAFGWAVAQGERQVMDHHVRGDFRATIFRYPNVYGPRANGRVLRSILQRVLDRRDCIIVPGNGERLRNRGYVDNLAHGILLAVENPRAEGEIYNICDERTLTLRELVEAICTAAGHSCEIVPVAHPRVEEICRGYVNEPHHQLFDLSKIKGELGYADRVPALEAVRRSVEWMIAHPPHEAIPAKGPNSGGAMVDPLDYVMEDRLALLSRTFHEEVERTIPPVGRERLPHAAAASGGAVS